MVQTVLLFWRDKGRCHIIPTDIRDEAEKVMSGKASEQHGTHTEVI
jgi:hypothetical protein